MDKKQTVDISTVGLLSNIGGDYARMREIKRNTHTVIDYRSSCNSCHKKFGENKYGIWYLCESCFEKNHSELELKVFNKLSEIFMNGCNHHLNKPDNHLTGIEHIKDNLFIIDIEDNYDKMDEWAAKINVLYKFEASDGIGNPLTEWLIEWLDS